MTIVNSEAPGVYVNVIAAPPSPNGNAPTGTWFVTGQPAQGPTGLAVPVTSMTDYANFLGARTSQASTIYDSLDEFFHDGGVLAYVSRIVGPSAVPATVTLSDTGSPSPAATLTITANGAGTWANYSNPSSGPIGVQVVVAAGTVSGSYTIAIVNNGTTVAKSPNLFVPQDAITWASSLAPWQVLVTITNNGSATAPPNNNPATGTFPLSGGVDDFAGVSETQWTNALSAFTASFGPGQVSAPGHTTAPGYTNLNAHAIAFNRVPLLDVADNSSAGPLLSQSSTFQGSAQNPSYGAFFAPWVQIPGIFPTNPAANSPIPLRTVPPSALAAALMARNDQTNDANSPAAGPNGQSTYAVGVTHQYVASDLANLNGAGINVIRPIQNTVTLYGYRSTSTDPNWVYLNNVRFRMQVVNDFQIIGEEFIFEEIDGQGHLFSAFNGALAGKCQSYWTNGSLYGTTPAQAFQINTGPQVNTPNTIQAGQLNAECLLHMSAFGEFVTVNVTKYLLTNAFPGQTQ
jgi:hypothetical protein